MFRDFNWQRYKNIKHPSDSSLKTLGEIKSLQKTPLDKSFAQNYDNIYNVYKRLFNKRTRKFPADLVEKVLKQSAKPILKIKLQLLSNPNFLNLLSFFILFKFS